MSMSKREVVPREFMTRRLRSESRKKVEHELLIGEFRLYNFRVDGCIDVATTTNYPLLLRYQHLSPTEKKEKAWNSNISRKLRLSRMPLESRKRLMRRQRESWKRSYSRLDPDRKLKRQTAWKRWYRGLLSPQKKRLLAKANKRAQSRYHQFTSSMKQILNQRRRLERNERLVNQHSSFQAVC
jgi:hypothetical protein